MVLHAGFIATCERYTACRCSGISWFYWAENNPYRMDLGAIQLFMSSKGDYY